MGKGKAYNNSSRHLARSPRQIPLKNPKWTTKAPHRNKNQQRKKAGIMLQILP